MDFFGIGALELLVILAIAFIVLGPTRMMDMAKGVGKIVREVRRSMSEVTKAVEEEEQKVRSSQEQNPSSRPSDKADGDQS